MRTTVLALLGRASSAALLLASAPSPAVAQEGDPLPDDPASGTDATSQVIDEEGEQIIVVTSRLREEVLQDVPLAITAFTARQIEDAGIDNVEDIARLTPGFTFTPLFGGNASTPVIRGLSTTIGEPNVGFFVDGVYQSSRSVMDSMLLGDIARVEIVRGPQSALYGRNTFGGAVNYITRTPTNRFNGRVEATAGSHEQYELRGHASGPLVDDALFFSLGASYAHRGGFFENTLSGRDLDDYSSIVVSGGLEARPSDAIRIRLRGAYENTDQRDFPIRFATNDAVPAQPAGPVFPPAFQLAGGTVEAFDTFAVTPGFNDREFITSALIVNADFGPFELTSITGYTDLDLETATDLDYEARRLRFQTQDVGTREISQEFRLASPASGPFSFLVGAYYYNLHSDSVIDDRIDADAAGIAAAIPASLRRQLQGGVMTTLEEDTESFALFGQIMFRPTDRLTLSVEGRQTWEDKSVVAVDTQQFGGGVSSFIDEAEFSNFVPRFTVDYQATDQVLLYASAAKAVKVGGFNVVTATGAILPEERTYDPETSWTYELGVKTTWLGGNLVFNADVFRIDWTDQIVRALGQTFAVLNANAGETTSQGFETELRYRPMPGLEFSGGLAYVDAQYDRYTFGALAALGLNPVLDGVQLQYVSKWQANGVVQYRGPITDRLDFFGRADIGYQSRQSAVQPANSFIGAATTVNLRAGFDYDNLQVRFFVENLTEEDASPAAAYIPSAAARFDWLRGAIGAGPRVGFQAFGAAVMARQPRTYGVTVGLRF